MSVWDKPRNPSFMPNPAEEDDFNKSLRGLGPEKPRLTAEQIKAAYEEAQREDQRQQAQAVSVENGKAFLAGHPEFIPSKTNIALMNHELQVRFGDGPYSIGNYEEVCESLRSSNFLNLDKTVIAAQEKQAAKNRYETETARRAERIFNEGTDYSTLSLEELRDRANEVISKDMQRAGERGGNGW